MLTSDRLRKDAGCWSCVHGKVVNVGNEVAVVCETEVPEFKEHGWQTALTCKTYRMKTIDRLYSAQRNRD